MAKVIVGSILVNLSYFIIGLTDQRLAATARRRHSNYGFMIDALKIVVLVILQLLFYIGAGLAEYAALKRLALHSVSILAYAFGTKMSVIGLTGGIACGKSTVVDFLKEKGRGEFKIIDSDKIAHDLYKKPDFVAKVFKIFGKDAVVSEDGKTVDRAKLGAIVFSDPAKRKKLNSMTHGPIFYEILWQIFNLRVKQGEALVILDAPLLFESKILEYLCYPIIIVTLKDVE